MPNYEYQCSSCGHEEEVFQKISEDPLKTCPSCGQETFERLISQSAFALKGDGWYADGYGAKPGEKAKPDTKSSPKPSAESKPSAETKPASPPSGDKPKSD